MESVVLGGEDGRRFAEEILQGMDIEDFGQVRDSVLIRLVNAEREAKRSHLLLYDGVLDLATMFYVPLGEMDGRSVSLKVTHSLAKAWGVDGKALYDLALKNTRREMPEEVLGLAEVIGQLTGCEWDLPDIPMLVVSNTRRAYGAAVILYDGVLDGLLDEFGGSFFILPSSLHEVIAVPEAVGVETDALIRMVRTVNAELLSEDEFLSDNVYYYSADGGLQMVRT